MRSARFRAAALATGVVAIALVVGAFALLSLLSSSLRDGVDGTLKSRVESRVRLIESGVQPSAVADPSADETFVWIGRADGQAIIATGNELTDPVGVLNAAGTDGVVRGFPVEIIETDLDAEHAREGEDDDDDDDEDGDEGPEIEQRDMRVVAALAQQPDGAIRIVAGSDLGRVDEAGGVARNLLLAGVPLATLLVGLVSWATLGRAFGPVEEIRRKAAEITGSRLDERVPVSGSGDEIDRLGSTMNDMLDRLSEHDQRQKRFTSDASHELKTPVANLRAIVETSDPASEPWPSIQTRLVGESERMTALVDDLLFVSTRDELAPSAVHESVHLDDLVFDEAAALKGRSQLKVDVSAVTPAMVTGDAGDLRRAIRNLADNAGRYAAGSVAFSVAESDGHAVVKISDDGPGIDPEDREVVFERFGRPDAARDRGAGGTGLGLSIVREIAQAHDGSVEITASDLTADSTGTCVVLSLPT